MIKTNDLLRGFELYQDEYENKAMEVLRSGWYILGDELAGFEKEFADYVGAKYCIGVASGLDALIIAIKLSGIGKGDEVIVQANTYIATVIAITQNGATPVFVEPDDYYGIDAKEIEKHITDKTKAILPVHLYGMPCKMDEIEKICRQYKLILIEDCAQSHGASYGKRMTGTFGNAGCFSFYPTKNLGAYGDGGCIVTNNEDLANKSRIYRNYGSEKKYYNKVDGINSRLDELQAGLLRVKLSHLEELNANRAIIADRYLKEITNKKIIIPKIRKNTSPVWHQFVVRCEQRLELIEFLKKREIATMVHYPIPPYLSEAYKYMGYERNSFLKATNYSDTVLSLPIYDGMTYEEQSAVIEAINDFE